MTCEQLTGERLVDMAKQSKPSAASLDQWKPSALSALAFWYPSLFEMLAEIFNYVETTGGWPYELTKGYTSLVPKQMTAERWVP